jgi:EmrB/QacA subfamily drug resistance transporter
METSGNSVQAMVVDERMRMSGGPATSHRWKVLGVTSLAVVMVFLDGTIVNVAFPSIHRSFPSTSQATLSWVLNAYSIVFAALLLASGRIADVSGRRRIFFTGLGVFTIGSVLCGLAPSAPVLDASRALQAVGAAMLLPASLALLLPAFPLSMRATAVGLWGATGAVAAASGPPLGALIIQSAGWRWAFLVNVPVGLLAWLLGRRVLEESRDPTATRWPDPLGIVLLTAGMGLLALGIVQGSGWGWTDPRIILTFAGAAVLVPLSVWRSATHPAPVIPLPLFRVRSFSLANVAAVSFSAAFAAMLLAGVLFLNGVWHYSILRTGFAVTPGPLMAATFAPLAGRLADRFGHRVVLVPGALIFAVAMLLFRARVGLHPDYLAVWLPAALLSGMGVGLTLPTLGSAAAASLPPERFGAGSAVTSTARQVGTVLGVSVLIALLGAPAPGDALAAFDRVWLFAAAGAVAASALCLGLGMTVHRQKAAADASPVLETAVFTAGTIGGDDAA